MVLCNFVEILLCIREPVLHLQSPGRFVLRYGLSLFWRVGINFYMVIHTSIYLYIANIITVKTSA